MSPVFVFCTEPFARPATRSVFTSHSFTRHYIHAAHFLDASTHLYKRVCPSVCPSVGPSVRWSDRNAFFFSKMRKRVFSTSVGEGKARGGGSGWCGTWRGGGRVQRGAEGAGEGIDEGGGRI